MALGFGHVLRRYALLGNPSRAVEIVVDLERFHFAVRRCALGSARCACPRPPSDLHAARRRGGQRQLFAVSSGLGVAVVPGGAGLRLEVLALTGVPSTET